MLSEIAAQAMRDNPSVWDKFYRAALAGLPVAMETTYSDDGIVFKLIRLDQPAQAEA